ncbi:prepilin-type N-terminal cleavage/methylation domain-containing protein [Halomonas sp. M5N1S17]|uniref:PilW family protein n=1 Tax=Halomonas alkalisoli TaxID=2907158 RepID=UPI001F20071D|nr:prepilin-type N-terminal cleavage/methylation domain-containing protein [Halomonas alkalisoli]MCE9663019.1 prepilin-type N-terminal cleavage/methylation domain-containing protein [Halomonas alkalisoli]
MNHRHWHSVFPSLGGGRHSRRQRGFSLVELMVALVIGLIIILGAGQLFLMGFQTFRQTELMGNKQAALTFATETLIRDIRRADNDQIVWDSSNNILEVGFVAANDSDGCSQDEDVVRQYYLSSDSNAREGFSLVLEQDCSDSTNPPAEPLVTGFASGGFEVDTTDSSFGVYVISFCLMDEPGETACVQDRVINFQAVNRAVAVQ